MAMGDTGFIALYWFCVFRGNTKKATHIQSQNSSRCTFAFASRMPEF